MKHFILPMVALLLFISCNNDNGTNTNTSQNSVAIPNNLQFTKMGSFGQSHSFGMVGSISQNALFFAQTININGLPCPNGGRPTSIKKFDLTTNTLTSHYHCTPDKFISKELTIINNKIYCIGSDTASEFNFDINQAPYTKNILKETVTPEQFNSGEAYWSRHGITSHNDDIFIFGGHSLKEEAFYPGNNSKKVFKYNTTSKAISFETTMPESLYFADGEIVNNKLYIFGGIPKWGDNYQPQDIIHIYDLSIGSWNTQQLPKPLEHTFTDRYNGLIFVGGGSSFKNLPNANNINFLGYFNPINNITKEINCTFSPPLNEKRFFQGMTIVENKIYIVASENDQENHIYVANLN